jgi:hypothetical protein
LWPAEFGRGARTKNSHCLNPLNADPNSHANSGARGAVVEARGGERR